MRSAIPPLLGSKVVAEEESSALERWTARANAEGAALNPGPKKERTMSGMKVVIRYAGMYSDFGTWPRVGARRHEEGEVVTFPTEYARGIIASGLAEPLVEAEAQAGPAEMQAEQAEAKPRRKRGRKGGMNGAVVK